MLSNAGRSCFLELEDLNEFGKNIMSGGLRPVNPQVRGRLWRSVLGILPPGKFFPERSTPLCSPPKKPNVFWFVVTLFRFVARFTRVRVASTAYFAKPGFVGGNVPGGNNRDGIFRGRIYRSPFVHYGNHLPVVKFQN